MAQPGQSAKLGRRAVVIGAGMGGMAAAAALSQAFDEVLVFDRDDLPAEAAPRTGTPQGLHGHVLLTGGLSALSDLFPGFGDALVAAGAETIRAGLDFRVEQGPFHPFPQRDLGWSFYGASRALYENIARRHLQKIPNVVICSGTRVDEILASEDQSTVTGVSTTGPAGAHEIVAADLVIDSSSHGQPTLKLLARLGRTSPVEDLIAVDLGYSSAMFERPESAPRDFKMMLTTPSPPVDSRSALLLPVEGNRWMVTLIGRGDQIPPGDWPGYMAFIDTLRSPTLKTLLRDAKPIEKVWRYRFAANIRRRFERLTDLPANLLPFGDVICRTNPAAGQGMSVAANEARLLSKMLARRLADQKSLAGLTAEFLAAAEFYVDHAWSTVAAQDFQFPGTKGDRSFADRSSQIFNAALLKDASENADLHHLWQQVAHMMQPMSALSDALSRHRVAELTN